MFAASKISNVSSSSVNYIEDVFSTWLYTGNGTTQTITNGIDLSTKGGFTWIKNRDAASNHFLFDTTRGINKPLLSAGTQAQATYTPSLYAFTTSGFSVDGSVISINDSAVNYASWTFRKQSKFFDVVTYTGTGSNTTIAHNLGSVPGCIFVKRTDTTANWQVYHRSLANTEYLVLNSTAAKATGATRWNSTTATSSVFSLGTDVTVNASGGTYVAYVFAHDAGGFGLTGTDNVISCGSFTTDGSGNATVSLGYEPQYVMLKCSSAVEGWIIEDTMRGANYSRTEGLFANTNDVEFSNTSIAIPTATGFVSQNGQLQTSQTYIYIAIRRGPMKVPTTGTSVFGLNARSGTSSDATVTGLDVVDLALIKTRSNVISTVTGDRLRGAPYLLTTATDAEATDTAVFQTNPWDVQNGVKVGTSGPGTIPKATNNSAYTYINWLFRRTPSFFDVVCYTGTGANTTQTHNLSVAPELWIIKGRSGATAWQVGSTSLANTEYLVLNSTAAKATGATIWNSTYPTSSVFSLGTSTDVNTLAATYVAYLFATCAGVSKVGSYTGNGTTQTINCGLTAGARFVLIKRTDTTGDWYVYDTARGMTTLTDPYLRLNSTAVETATLGSVTTVSTGFALNSAILAAINVNAGTYIFLAIA